MGLLGPAKGSFLGCGPAQQLGVQAFALQDAKFSYGELCVRQCYTSMKMPGLRLHKSTVVAAAPFSPLLYAHNQHILVLYWYTLAARSF